MAYVNTFGGQPQNPAQVDLRVLTLTASVSLYWPWNNNSSADVLAKIMRVSANPSLAITLPPANQASVGEASIFINIGASSFDVLDNTGASVGTVAAGTAKFFYLFDNTTIGGSWSLFTFGTGSSAADASALAGAGLLALGGTLNQAMATTNISSTGFTISSGSRAIFYNWTGGADTVTLDTPANLGSQWFITIRNSGSGTLILAKTTGTIDGVATKSFQPGDSATIVTDGTNFFSIGFGQSSAFSFDYIAINVAGTGTYTLSASEQNRISYKFTGLLTGNRDIVVPNTVQQYWPDNSTTGAFTLGLKTAAQVGNIAIAQGSRDIFYCNGSEVVDAVTGGVSTPISIANGGTGATTASGARTNLGSTTLGDALFISASAAAARTSLGLGTIATQAASAVAITGGTIAGVTLGASTGAFTGAVTISNAATGVLETITSTDAGASAGPIIDLYRNSASPAPADSIGGIQIAGQNSTPAKIVYVLLSTQILDATAGSEDSIVTLSARSAGALTGISVSNGMIVGAPTGTFKGNGTLNVEGLYVGGVAVTPASSGVLVAHYHAELTAYTACSTIIPYDDSPPLVTEGTQILSRTAITTSATQVLLVTVSVNVYQGSGGNYAWAVWRDGTTLVGSAFGTTNGVAPNMAQTVEFQDSPAGAATYTYTVRCGPTAGSLFINGTAGGRIGGGSQRGATIDIDVIEP